MCVVEILIAHAAVVSPERKRMYTVRDRQRERDFVSSHTPVLYSSCELQVVVNNLHFLMWDVSGQEGLRQSWSMYYSGWSCG
jgi:GTPase SAR1 family protein